MVWLQQGAQLGAFGGAGRGNVEGLVNVVTSDVVTSVLVPEGDLSFFVHQERLDVSWLRDWQWHELVLELALDGKESVSTFLPRRPRSKSCSGASAIW